MLKADRAPATWSRSSGRSLPASAARRCGPCRLLPPARAGDLLAVLPSRPLAVALVDGLFDTTPSVWHREILAALEAGVAVFGAASLGALRAAELWRHGMVGIGRVYAWYRDGDPGRRRRGGALHAGAEHGFRPLTVPLVQVRAARLRARAQGGWARPARPGRSSGPPERLHYTERTWPAVLAGRGPRRPHAEASSRGSSSMPRREGRRRPGLPRGRARLRAGPPRRRARSAPAGRPAALRPPPPPAPGTRAGRAPRRRRGPGGEQCWRALSRRPTPGPSPRTASGASCSRGGRAGLGLLPDADGEAAALRAWLARLGAGPRTDARRPSPPSRSTTSRPVLAPRTSRSRRGSSRSQPRVVPDGPSWEEGLALGARLSAAPGSRRWRRPRSSRLTQAGWGPQPPRHPSTSSGRRASAGPASPDRSERGTGGRSSSAPRQDRRGAAPVEDDQATEARPWAAAEPALPRRVRGAPGAPARGPRAVRRDRPRFRADRAPGPGRRRARSSGWSARGAAGRRRPWSRSSSSQPAELARWADELKRSLGCGGGVEGRALVVQGDQRDRVVRWLTARGVRKVVRG